MRTRGWLLATLVAAGAACSEMADDVDGFSSEQWSQIKALEPLAGAMPHNPFNKRDTDVQVARLGQNLWRSRSRARRARRRSCRGRQRGRSASGERGRGQHSRSHQEDGEVLFSHGPRGYPEKPDTTAAVPRCQIDHRSGHTPTQELTGQAEHVLQEARLARRGG